MRKTGPLYSNNPGCASGFSNFFYFGIPFLFLLLATLNSPAQTPPPHNRSNPPQDPLFTLMLSQPRVDLESEAPPTASFDPPVIHPGDQSIYRVTFQALEQSVEWPSVLSGPKELKLEPGAHGQMLQPTGGPLLPITSFNTRVRAAAPGTFTIPSFEIMVYGKKFVVPAATLEVRSGDEELPAAPKPWIELDKTNVYVGQPMVARVHLPASPNGAIQGLHQFQITGSGLLVDQGNIRQSIASTVVQGRPFPTITYESIVTPVRSGDRAFFAQGFLLPFAQGFPSMPLAPGVPPAPARPSLIESLPVHVNARDLPSEGRLPGFNGAIGKIAFNGVVAETNVVRAGDTVKLTASYRCDNDVFRLVPPVLPRVRDWQIFAAETNSPMTRPTQFQRVISFAFTFVPLSEKATATPPIPFSAFDPEKGAYTDLSIPSVPITVKPGPVGRDVQLLVHAGRSVAKPEEAPVLSGLASATGASASRLAPTQQRLSFLAAQLLPLAGFTGLWLWDRRRRYFERNPGALLRLRARRALRRERRALRQAAKDHDAKAFANRSVSAMRVACAPHYPAEPRALVGSEILQVLGENGSGGKSGEIVRRVFHAADSSQYNFSDSGVTDLLGEQADIEQVIHELEAKL